METEQHSAKQSVSAALAGPHGVVAVLTVVLVLFATLGAAGS